QESSNIESMEQGLRQNGSQAEFTCRKTEQVSDIGHLIVRASAKRDPAEHQGERDRDAKQAPPKDGLVHPPSQWGALSDKALHEYMARRNPQDRARTAKRAALPEQLPSPVPVQPGGRLIQPDVVMVDHTPGSENHRERVDDQCRIEVLQVP